MKTKNMFLVMLILLTGAFSQEIKADNSNGMFVDTKTPNHIVTDVDVKQVAYYIDRNQIIPGKWYTLKSGFIFKMDNPPLFKTTMLSILSEVKGVQVDSIRPEFDNIQILDWDDNISTKTLNYHMKGGKLGYSNDYSGGKGVRVVMYKGYPVLKVGKPCFNPNRPKIEKNNNLLDGEKNTHAKEEKVADNDENVVYTDRVSDQTTSNNSDCYVLVDVPQYGQATQTYYAGIGENTGYLGNRTTSTSQTVFLGYRKEKVPCSVYEDYRQMSEPQQKTWCERNPVWCTILLNTRINVGVQVSGNNNNRYYYGGGNTTGGTYTPNGGPGGPTPTGGPGGPTPTGGNGGPGGPKPRGR